LIGRSFKYHRPRGIYTCGIEEPNGIVQILSEHNEPNTRATVKQIYDRMEIESQNRWPSLILTLEQLIIYCHQYFLQVFITKLLWVPKFLEKNL
jgi:sarcosine oxidase subunit alpha